MSYEIALGVMSCAFMLVIVLGALLNYRWMKRIAEREDLHHGNR